MRFCNRFGILALLIVSMFMFVPAASAHPLGNFTINHFSGIHIATNSISVDYVLDMAEIPAFQEISLLDKNQNGKADPNELLGYSDRQCNAILTQLDLQRNNAHVSLSLSRSTVSFPPGAGGLSTLRLTCAFQSQTIQFSLNDQIYYQDNSYSGRIGWKEIVVFAEGIPLDGQFATSSVSKELTAYPQDLLSSPLDVRQVSLKIGSSSSQPTGLAGQPGRQTTSAWSAAGRSDRFTQLITLDNLTPTSLILALLIAFIWGGLHSLTPGHGKTIVAAYLVGSRGTAVHAVFLGLLTTLTHTAGVFLLGLITLFASRYILPEQLFPWISILSGIMVLTIGVSLFASRLRGTQVWKDLSRRMRKPAHQASLLPKTALQISSISTRSPAQFSRGSVVMSGVHRHEDGTVHMHEGRPHHHEHEHGLEELHTHSHGPGGRPGGHTHTHLPPGTDGSKVTWRSLLALGVSGGLLPCPSALVVLLGAIALNRIGFGVVLVLVFSLGLAGVLTGIGLMLVFARRYFDRLPLHSRFIELIPAGSALFITVLGIGVTLQALAQLGWIAL